MNARGSVDLEGVALSGNDLRDSGVECLSLLYEHTCGMEVGRDQGDRLAPYEHRMRTIWMKNDKSEDERNEWTTRWREMVDLMEEEGVADILTEMLCIPEDKLSEDGMIIPSKSSIGGMFALGNGIVGGCHFDLCPHKTSDIGGKRFVIRNLPYGYWKYDPAGRLVFEMMQSEGIRVADSDQILHRIGRSLIVSLPVVTVLVQSDRDVRRMEQRINGRAYHGCCLSVKRRG